LALGAHIAAGRQLYAEFSKEPDVPQDEMIKLNTATEQPGSGKRQDRWRNWRHFGLFVILLVLFCAIGLLVTNGLYMWLSRPGQEALANVQTRLEGKMPDGARTEAERLAFYEDCATLLADWPEKAARLDSRFWTFAVLVKDETGQAGFRSAQDAISRGENAVRAYMQAVAALSTEIASYRLNGDDPADLPADLPGRLEWYINRVSAADRLKSLFADSNQLPDLDLAGHFFTDAELGLAEALAGMNDYEQPVRELSLALEKSEQLESDLDSLYAADPSQEGLAGNQARCAELIKIQAELSLQAEALSSRLPQPLQDASFAYQHGMVVRTAFVQAIEAWWHSAVLTAQSVRSAESDRATAKRYIADSLQEENVQTAYLWTRTAAEYRVSMNTAIDFANIYIAQVNQQISRMQECRQEYRAALGLPSASRIIAQSQVIDAEEFWLAG
jgi:hypothetical protein